MPLLRLLGVTKMRIAQINTAIGVIKASIKQSSTASIESERQLEKVVSNFMDAMTRQIEA